MILVVEDPIDYANYVDIAMVLEKHPTPNVFHISWPGFVIDEIGEPTTKRGRKLYITGHGNPQMIGDYGPNDLGRVTQNLIVGGRVDKIILLACSSGEETTIEGASGLTTYCKVFADKLALDTKRTFPVTGFSGSQTTMPGGHSRVVKEDEESDTLRTEILERAFKGNEHTLKELKRWCKSQRPVCPGDLILISNEVYKRFMGCVNEPAKTWSQLEVVVKSKSASKVYVNRT